MAVSVVVQNPPKHLMMTSISMVEELMSCTVCMDIFTSPKLLPCHHTYCAMCLVPLLKTSTIECPICRKVSSVPNGIEDLPNDFRADQLRDILHNMQRKMEGSVRRCDLCHYEDILSPGKWYCYNCQKTLCNICNGRHDRKSQFYGHTVMEATSLENVHCTQHRREFLSAYCMVCDKPVCTVCALTCCFMHKTVDILGPGPQTNESQQFNTKSCYADTIDLDLQIKEIQQYEEYLQNVYISPTPTKHNFPTKVHPSCSQGLIMTEPFPGEYQPYSDYMDGEPNILEPIYEDFDEGMVSQSSSLSSFVSDSNSLDDTGFHYLSITSHSDDYSHIEMSHASGSQLYKKHKADTVPNSHVNKRTAEFALNSESNLDIVVPSHPFTTGSEVEMDLSCQHSENIDMYNNMRASINMPPDLTSGLIITEHYPQWSIVDGRENVTGATHNNHETLDTISEERSDACCIDL